MASKSNSKVGRFPVRGDGSLIHSPGWDEEDVTWVENQVFDAGLAFVGLDIGRSAMNVRLVNVDSGAEYHMKLRDFQNASELAIPSRAVVAGKERLVLSWIWTFRRSGNHNFIVPCEGPANV